MMISLRENISSVRRRPASPLLLLNLDLYVNWAPYSNGSSLTILLLTFFVLF